MAEPSSRSFYTTLLSKGSKGEFPSNGPAAFKGRLPEAVRVQDWDVGLAGVYLPASSGSKTSSSSSKPDVSQLYEGSAGTQLFKIIWNVKDLDTSRLHVLSATIDKTNRPEAHTGVEWMKKVTRQLVQSLVRQMDGEYTVDARQVVGSSAEGGKQTIFQFRWEGEDLVLDVSKTWVKYEKDPMVSIDVTLAMKMGWLIRKSNGVYDVGPNLLLEPVGWPLEYPSSDRLKTSWRFRWYFHVQGGQLYLPCVYNWRFVQLNEMFESLTSVAPTRERVYTPMRPVMVYCNAGESMAVGTQMTDLLSLVPYKGEATCWQPPEVQYRRARGQVLEIVEVNVSEVDGTLVPLDGQTVVVLHFRRRR